MTMNEVLLGPAVWRSECISQPFRTAHIACMPGLHREDSQKSRKKEDTHKTHTYMHVSEKDRHKSHSSRGNGRGAMLRPPAHPGRGYLYFLSILFTISGNTRSSTARTLLTDLLPIIPEAELHQYGTDFDRSGTAEMQYSNQLYVHMSDLVPENFQLHKR